MTSENLKVKDWFFKKLEPRHGFFILGDDFRIMKETEKAVLASFDICSRDGEYESVQDFWIPKSCLEDRKAYEEAREKAFNEGCERYNKLLAFAKANNLPVRNHMKTSTIMSYIKGAGLTYEA